MQAAAAATSCRVPIAAVRALSRLAAVLPLPLVPDQLKRLQSVKEEGFGDAQRDLGFAPARLQERLAESA